MEEKELNIPPSLENICHACLSQDRNTFALGEYRDIFARLTPFYKSNSQHTKLCWECMAILRQFYVFERKCYIAYKVLCSKWSDTNQKCLSNLSITPVNISNFTINNECDTDIVQVIKEEETSNNYRNDYDETFDYLNEIEPDYGTNYDDVTHGATEEKLQMQDKSHIKLFNNEEEMKVDCEFDSFNTLKEDNDSVVNTEESSQNLGVVVKVKSEETEEKVKVNVQQRKNRLSRKDLEGHFRIVKKDLNKIQYLKIKIEEDNLENLRNSERTSEFFEKKPYKCNDCICFFARSKHLARHKLQVHDESLGRYMCDICKARFASKTTLASHVLNHYYILKCTDCEFNSYSKQRIKSHVKQHKRSVQCVHCSLNFTNTTLFYKHFKANHSAFICDHCGKKCRTKYTLEKHMRHHSERNICLICNKVYKSRNSLRNHCDLKHNQASSELAYCVQCDKQFANIALYKRHVLSSAAHALERDGGRGNKQIRCPLCDKVYSRKTYMMNHYRYVHIKQSKYYCVDCNKHFLNRTRYVEHRKYQHEGELKVKDKMCNICGRGFAANRTLRNHLRTHSGERPYECEHCNASFTQKHCMVSHVKYIHMKNKRRGLS